MKENIVTLKKADFQKPISKSLYGPAVYTTCYADKPIYKQVSNYKYYGRNIHSRERWIPLSIFWIKGMYKLLAHHSQSQVHDSPTSETGSSNPNIPPEFLREAVFAGGRSVSLSLSSDDDCLSLYWKNFTCRELLGSRSSIWACGRSCQNCYRILRRIPQKTHL